MHDSLVSFSIGMNTHFRENCNKLLDRKHINFQSEIVFTEA